MTWTEEDSASTEYVIDLRPGVRHDPTPCDTTYECPRTPADQEWADVTPGFLIGVVVPVLLVCLLAWFARR